MKNSRVVLAVALVAIISAAGIVVATQSGGMPAQKIAFSWSDVKNTYNANTTAIPLGSGILKVANDEEAIITFDADVGLDTNTTITGKGNTATSDTNYASVQAYAIVEPGTIDNSGTFIPTPGASYLAQPGVITLADRLQTLSGLLSAGTILPDGTVTNASAEWISLVLNTTNAEGWHFVTPLSGVSTSNSGIYRITVYGKVTLSAYGQTAAMPAAIIGPRTLIVEEVRQIKDNSGNLFFS